MICKSENILLYNIYIIRYFVIQYLCPDNICPGKIWPYQQYLGCYWSDFDQTFCTQFLGVKIFVEQNVLGQNFFRPNFFGTKFFSEPTYF